MYFKQILNERCGCASYLIASRQSHEAAIIDPSIALEQYESLLLLLDVREPEEYAHGHVPGARNLPQAELASRLDEVPRDRALLVICQGGLRSLRAAQFLKQMTFASVTNVKGGTAAWQASGKPLHAGDADAERPRVAESAWAHAGGSPVAV